jgi:hypothetical protein
MFVMVFILVSCSPVTVKTDYDHEYDFSQYKSYRWAEETELAKTDVLAKNPLVYKRVQKAVDKDLQAKGFTREESGDTDFVVVAHAGTKDRMQINQYGGYGGWYHPFWGPYGGYTDVSHYTEGSLVIDLVDSKKKELAWRGTGTGIVKDYKDSDKMQKDLDESVAKILASFPPQP